MTPFEYITSSLKQANMRLTPQRIAICKLLSETDEHPTAAAIYDQIKGKYPSLSLMTVYNTLNTLVELGTVSALGNAGDGNIHYDGNTSPHINLACISCHKIIDIASPNIPQLDNEITDASGFKLIGARIMYYGLCPDCQNSTVQ